MSEAFETYSGDIGSQGPGTRFAQPFLHEPQPRAGTAKPRWTPSTASLGTAAEVMTEDWDIL